MTAACAAVIACLQKAHATSLKATDQRSRIRLRRQLADADGDGVCDELKPQDAPMLACNYDADATDDDGSCAELDECGVCGGGIAEGACDCEGNGQKPDTTATATASVMQTATVCATSLKSQDARTLKPATTTRMLSDAGDCEYAEESYGRRQLLGGCRCDGVCDGFESAGCADAMACNYDAEATDGDDGWLRRHTARARG